MILISVGMSSHVADWYEMALLRLASLRGSLTALSIGRGAHHQSENGSILDQVTKHLIGGDAANLLVRVRGPDDSFRDLLLESDARFMLVLQDPREIIAEFCGNGSLDHVTATRLLANECRLLTALAALPNCLVIGPRRTAENDRRLISNIADHFEIRVTTEQIVQVQAQLDLQKTSLNASSYHIRPDIQKLVDGALGAYATYFSGSGQTLGDIIWHRHLFMRPVGGSPIESIRLADTNNGAFLIYGPYIDLPPGHWLARVVFGVSPDAAGHPLLVDAFSGRQLASTIFLPPSGGVFSVEMNLVLDESTCRNLEIRMCVGKQNEPGELAFGHVLLRPVLVHHAEAAGPQEDFRVVFEL